MPQFFVAIQLCCEPNELNRAISNKADPYSSETSMYIMNIEMRTSRDPETNLNYMEKLVRNGS